MTSAFPTLLIRAACLGVFVALCAALAATAIDSVREGYVEHGLWALAAEVLLRKLLVAGAAALAASAIGAAIASLAREPFGATGRLGAFAASCIALPTAAVAAVLATGLELAPAGALVAGCTALALAIARASSRVLSALGAAALTIVVALFAVVSTGALRPPAAPGRPNILLVMLDTVRADRISSYGYDRPTTPELDAFAERGIRFANFYSTSSWTVPSHASLFTGLFPREHGATQEHVWLASRFATLAEILRNAGYTTWAVSGNPWLGPQVNLDQGFETFFEAWRGKLAQKPRREEHPANVAFARFLEGAEPGRPFFAFVHYMDAHAPFLPPEPFRSRFLAPGVDAVAALQLADTKWIEYYRGRALPPEDLAVLSDLYDASIAYLSAAVGRLLDTLEASGRYDDTLIVVTSDHGEHFGENDLLGHMFGLYNATVRVPLFVRLPKGERAGEVDTRTGQLVDLFVTLLATAGVDVEGLPRDGVDLLADDPAERRATVFSEYYYPAQALAQFSDADLAAQAGRIDRYKRRLRAVQRYGLRLVWSSDGRHELYDLRSDPGESRNIYEEAKQDPARREFLALLEAELRERVPDLDGEVEARGGVVPELDDETREALRAVGYLE